MYLVAACSLKLRPVGRKIASKLQLKRFYGSLSGNGSRETGSRKSISLNSTPSPLGFQRMRPTHEESMVLDS